MISVFITIATKPEEEPEFLYQPKYTTLPSMMSSRTMTSERRDTKSRQSRILSHTHSSEARVRSKYVRPTPREGKSPEGESPPVLEGESPPPPEGESSPVPEGESPPSPEGEFPPTNNSPSLSIETDPLSPRVPMDPVDKMNSDPTPTAEVTVSPDRTQDPSDNQTHPVLSGKSAWCD